VHDSGPAAASPGAEPDNRDQAPPAPAATVKVSVFHNVETDAAGRHVGFFGYRPGHALVRVFEAEVPVGDGTEPQMLAELMFKVGNAPLEHLAGLEREMAESYRSRSLRSISVGDVVVIGETPLACGKTGWEPVTGTVSVTGAGEPGSIPLPLRPGAGAAARRVPARPRRTQPGTDRQGRQGPGRR
jgi:hypothetical protein